jgi:hypothetical protein
MVEEKTEGFAKFLEDLNEEPSDKGRGEEIKDSPDG